MCQLWACYRQVLASIRAGLTVYALIHSAPAWGPRRQEQGLGSGLGCQKLSRLAFPAPSPSPARLTF